MVLLLLLHTIVVVSLDYKPVGNGFCIQMLHQRTKATSKPVVEEAVPCILMIVIKLNMFGSMHNERKMYE